jgi:hypothetical protein
MKIPFSKYLFSGLLLLAYVAGVIGVGKHYCRCEEVAQVVLSAVEYHACCRHEQPRQETPAHCCQAAPEAENTPCAGASETENITGSECCTVQVELLQIDQNVPAFAKIIPDFHSLFLFCSPPVALFTNNAPAVTAAILTNPPPLFNTKHPLFSQVQQWRL